jgi:TonB-dependent SusC/RagA subfamily outer membrane receptor
MLTPSHSFSGRAVLPLSLSAGILVGLVTGCAHPSTTGEAQPEVAAQQDSVEASPAVSREIVKRPHESIESLLNTRTSGVMVSMNADGSLSIRIRGVSSMYGSNEPLYVIDGIPVRVGPGGTLAGVNPYEIESIEVLKGPPETSIYGLRGANGVILIKTKHAG